MKGALLFLLISGCAALVLAAGKNGAFNDGPDPDDDDDQSLADDNSDAKGREFGNNRGKLQGQRRNEEDDDESATDENSEGDDLSAAPYNKRNRGRTNVRDLEKPIDDDASEFDGDVTDTDNETSRGRTGDRANDPRRSNGKKSKGRKYSDDDDNSDLKDIQVDADLAGDQGLDEFRKITAKKIDVAKKAEIDALKREESELRQKSKSKQIKNDEYQSGVRDIKQRQKNIEQTAKDLKRSLDQSVKDKVQAAEKYTKDAIKKLNDGLKTLKRG